MSLNKWIGIGLLGKDPETKHTSNGSKVVSFSIATNESYKDKQSGERKTTTEWHNIVVWGALADICEKYLKKGSKVYVEGKLQTKKVEGDQGTKYYTSINCKDMKMLDSKPQTSQTTKTNEEDYFTNQGPVDQDDLPF